ncbi:hypothetical protein N9Z17_05375, partial [Planktomarina temperata]|nr:hypothetical protein [Planktomarina temperata]
MSDIKPNFNQNKFANGAGTIFVMAIGIIILPIYGNIIGPEFITILGIYLAISAASLSVDLGLIQRFVRKVSENSQKNIDVDDCRMLWKVLKVLLIRVTILSIPIIIMIYGLFIQTNGYINRIFTPSVFVTFLVLSALTRILSSLL